MENIHKVYLQSDISEVTKDIELLDNQLESLSHTLKRLNDNGIDLNIKIKLNQSKFKNIFKAKER